MSIPKQPHVAPSVASAEGKNPHFDAIGGEPVITRLVERFYDHMSTLPEAADIRAMHAADLTSIKDVFRRFLTEWTGGPAIYSATRGHPRLRRRHLPFRIGPAERDAWMACMRLALDEVISDEEIREQLYAAFDRTAGFLRNDAGHVHIHHNPSV